MDKKEALSLTSENRINNLIIEATNELEGIIPEIKQLEESIQRLHELKAREHKLHSLIINLKSILPQINTNNDVIKTKVSNEILPEKSRHTNVNKISIDTLNGRKVFIPDVAISNAKNYLRTKNNINYEIYKAVVFNTGEASTEEIKYYLVKNKIRQPKTGLGFENVPLKEISSRINYLVRKGILISYQPGYFSTVFGWEEI